MKANYQDIVSRIKEDPAWYDQNGTPRYGAFHPDLCPSIYANSVGLFLIACQDCKDTFRVEMHCLYWGTRTELPPSKWHYGDPPIHDCVGDTMNCDDLQVLEFWAKDQFDWVRRSELEGVIDASS